jgi:porin
MALAVFLLMAAGPVNAQERDAPPAQDTARARAGLGGPDQVDNQLESDREPAEPLVRLTFLQPYFDFKDRLKEGSGLGFGLDYTALALSASAALEEDNASSGIARLFGSWELVGRGSSNSGSLVFKFEHRHKYPEIAPKVLSFNVGYVGIIGGPYSDQEFRWTNLYWRQGLGDGRFVVLGGFLDATDFVDVYGLASPWLHFTNLAFSTGSASMALPNDALLGVAVGAWISDHVYTIASFGDNGSDPTRVFTGFDRFFNVKEYFKSVEVGWTSARDRAYFDNVHVTFWHSDEKSETGDPSGWGLNVSGTTYINDKVMPFLRAGYAEDGGSLLEASVSAGVGYQAVPGRDLLGFGANWGKPNETTWGEELPDQYTFELFWRWFLGEQLAVTPQLQYFINPALNPDESTIYLFGVRGRLAL